jgi:hypothetical protein
MNYCEGGMLEGMAVEVSRGRVATDDKERSSSSSMDVYSEVSEGG